MAQKNLFQELELPTTAPLFPGEIEPPSPEAEAAYSAASRELRKANVEPVQSRERFEAAYTKKRKRNR